MTVVVYGLVAAIVKIDDLGLHLLSRNSQVAQTFGRWLLASPSTWWNDRVIFDIESAQPRQAIGAVAAPGRVFLSVGSEEQQVGEIPMIANTRDLHAVLQGPRRGGLDVTLAMLEGELHHSTIPAAVSRGLRWLYR